ncbi:MAG: hypothetical protein IT483_11915 [Gammaproteobacteria bacterium]|nr:hypothetical protein [Gammaproteobacteria bacterium]
MDYFQYRRPPSQDVEPPLARHQGRAFSILRLVNLALGIAATIALPGGFRWLWRAVTDHWLLPSVMKSMLPATLACTHLAVTLALPAAVLMLLLAAFGLHTKLETTITRKRVAGLAAVWMAYVGWTLAGHLILPEAYQDAGDAAWAVGMLVSLVIAPFFIATIAWGAISAWHELGALLRTEPATDRSPAGLLVWSLLLPVALTTPLLMDPSRPLARSAAEDDQFDALCRGVGVRLMARPAGPVRSIAYDWDPQRHKYGLPLTDYVELDSRGRIRARRFSSPPRTLGRNKRLDFDFTESRASSRRSGAATIRPDAPYYRFPSFRARQPFYGVDALGADVLLYSDANRPEELHKAPGNQGIVRYELTLKDRRSGATLGVQTYVLDQVNGRGCGANASGIISQGEFIYDAIHR